MVKVMKKKAFIETLVSLDGLISKPLKLLVAGGGAMILAHQYPLATYDMDAIPFQSDWTIGELDIVVKKVAELLNLSPDWLNPYFATFSYVLPKDYHKRLISIYEGKYLRAVALGAEDLLIMKCFAGRGKDVGHARYLLKKCKHIDFVEKHLEHLLEEGFPKAQETLDFFDEIKSQVGK